MLLDTLTTHSSLLLRVTTVESQVHFVVLETLREYALEKLSAPTDTNYARKDIAQA
jgi:hypothetical protein